METQDELEESRRQGGLERLRSLLIRIYLIRRPVIGQSFSSRNGGGCSGFF
jgi:hypothetical protein